MANDPAPIVVAALYKFADFPDYESHRQPLLTACLHAGVNGTILLAHEGINGTIAGSRNGIDAVLSHISRIPGFGGLEHKESFAPENPFYRMKVRLKREIVTMGVTDIDPNQIVGTYVDPQDWNALISDPEVVVIDTRNDYEVSIGTFRGAIDPKTRSFREFPNWFAEQDALRPEALQGKKVAMFCTGGIRCEKATAFARQQGLEDVYHLKGGILKYLETVPQQDSLWQGDCFVFDQRVSVTQGLAPGQYDMCHACRMPIDAADKASPHYIEGVSCPKCHDRIDADRKQRFLERQKQVELAEKQGRAHIGQVYESSARKADD